ncbi:MAG: DUF1445 domain-containing protein [Chloroflexi bacterium]|nr:DUF1445 domain-containing protein [Chloroflexota bacterium]
MKPADFRSKVRQGQWSGPNALKVCQGYALANLAIVPEKYAFEFMLFCKRNPRPCPVLDVTDPGDPHPRSVAPEADLKTDIPKYRVFRDGKLIDEPVNISAYWRDDLVAFLLGCSISFDWALEAANIKYRLLGDYFTDIPCVPAGHFRGRMAVSGRAFASAQAAIRAVQISSRYPAFHGPPVHIGDEKAIGIKDLDKPDAYAPPWPVEPKKPEEVTMFWGCGITPQAVALEAKLPLMITHWPGHMFVTDMMVEELAGI